MHNIHPLVSPSIYPVLREHKVRIVQTIHNYRWFCIGATLYRAGHVCEDCLRKPGGRLHGLGHRCYRRGLGASAILTLTQQRHAHPRRTFGRSIQRILVQSDFVRDLFLERGFPTGQVAVHANFLAQPAPAGEPWPRTGPVVFAGRLEAMKGADVFLRAAALLPELRFEILGAGTARPELEALAARLGIRNVEFPGRLPAAECRARIGRALAVVVPSLWYESFPLVILEGFAQRTPVVVSRLGSLPHIVRDGSNGLCFEPGSAPGLAARIRELADMPSLRDSLTQQAYADWQARYAPQAALERLEQIYRRVLSEPFPIDCPKR